MNNKSQKWHHPGGKLRELGAESLTDAELLSHQAKSHSIGHTRRLIKAELKKELEQIDKIVKQILGSSEGSRYATSQGGEV
jgi:hypothetical protein